MKKIMFALVPLMLFSYDIKPTSTSESSMETNDSMNLIFRQSKHLHLLRHPRNLN